MSVWVSLNSYKLFTVCFYFIFSPLCHTLAGLCPAAFVILGLLHHTSLPVHGPGCSDCQDYCDISLPLLFQLSLSFKSHQFLLPFLISDSSCRRYGSPRFMKWLSIPSWQKLGHLSFLALLQKWQNSLCYFSFSCFSYSSNVQNYYLWWSRALKCYFPTALSILIVLWSFTSKALLSVPLWGLLFLCKLRVLQLYIWFRKVTESW